MSLAAWREADRRWEATDRDAPEYRQACISVIRAWLAYHASVDHRGPGEIALVADDDRTYVGISPNVEEVLGYPPESVLGRRIEDLAAPSTMPATGDQWAAFIAEGRQDGVFDMIRSDGTVARMRYQARAHYPIANYHLSRLWLEVPAGAPHSARGA